MRGLVSPRSDRETGDEVKLVRVHVRGHSLPQPQQPKGSRVLREAGSEGPEGTVRDTAAAAANEGEQRSPLQPRLSLQAHLFPGLWPCQWSGGKGHCSALYKPRTPYREAPQAILIPKQGPSPLHGHPAVEPQLWSEGP